jgi:hypothetical protein
MPKRYLLAKQKYLKQNFYDNARRNAWINEDLEGGFKMNRFRKSDESKETRKI